MIPFTNRAINDERVEVRTTAQAALSGLIHCGLVEITEEQLNEVKSSLHRISSNFKALKRKKMIANRKKNSMDVTSSSQSEFFRQNLS